MTARHSQTRKDDPNRYLNLHWVMGMVIGQFAPLSWADRPAVRLLRQAHADMHADDEKTAGIFEASSLHEDKVKHLLGEIYATQKKHQKERLKMHVLSAPLPCVSLQVDFCKSKTSGDQYFGKSQCVSTYVISLYD